MQYRKKGHPIEYPRDLGDIYFQLCIWSIFFLVLVTITFAFSYIIWEIIKIFPYIFETLRITYAII